MIVTLTATNPTATVGSDLGLAIVTLTRPTTDAQGSVSQQVGACPVTVVVALTPPDIHDCRPPHSGCRRDGIQDGPQRAAPVEWPPKSRRGVRLGCEPCVLRRRGIRCSTVHERVKKALGWRREWSRSGSPGIEGHWVCSCETSRPKGSRYKCRQQQGKVSGDDVWYNGWMADEDHFHTRVIRCTLHTHTQHDAHTIGASDRSRQTKRRATGLALSSQLSSARAIIEQTRGNHESAQMHITNKAVYSRQQNATLGGSLRQR